MREMKVREYLEISVLENVFTHGQDFLFVYYWIFIPNKYNESIARGRLFCEINLSFFFVHSLTISQIHRLYYMEDKHKNTLTR